MSRKPVRAMAAALAIALVLALPTAAHAMSLRQGQDIVLGRAETVADDLYAFGSTIQIDGTVDGDVVAGGQTIVIAGTVTGDVLAAGQSVRITGDVGGSVRASGADVTVEGTVKGDVLASGGTVRVGSQARVGRDAALAGGTVTVLGAIGRNSYIGASTVSVQGPVDGDLRASAGQITIGSGGKIGGGFEYWSDAEPVVDGSVVGKTVAHPAQTSRRTAGQTFLAGLLSWVRGSVGWALFGLLALLLVPAAFSRSAEVLRARPWPSLGIGFAALVVPPVLALLVFILTLVVGGWWIAFLLMSVWVLLIAAGCITGALTVGRLVGSRMSSPPADLLAMLLGLAIVRVVGAVPFIGGLVGFAVTLFGMGALVRLAYDAMRRQRATTAVAMEPEAAAPAVTGATAPE